MKIQYNKETKSFSFKKLDFSNPMLFAKSLVKLKPGTISRENQDDRFYHFGEYNAFTTVGNVVRITFPDYEVKVGVVKDVNQKWMSSSIHHGELIMSVSAPKTPTQKRIEWLSDALDSFYDMESFSKIRNNYNSKFVTSILELCNYKE